MRKKQDSEIIYKTALTFFAKYGYKKTTLEDIAAALNMTTSNMYSYASSKQTLYYDSVSYGIDAWQEYVRVAVAKKKRADEKLLTAFEAAVNYIDKNEIIQELLKNDPSIFPMFPAVDPIEELNKWSISFIGEILTQGVESGVFKKVNVKDTSLILFNLYKYLIISSYVDQSEGSISLKEHKATIADIIFSGLNAR